MRRIIFCLALGASVLAACPVGAQHYQRGRGYYQPPQPAYDPWTVFGGAVLGGIVGGVIIAPQAFAPYPSPPPYYVYPQRAPTCGAVFLGEDQFGRPIFGNHCR